MPYKDKEAQKKAVAQAVKKHRKGITIEGITSEGITTDNVTPYHPILKYLVPGEKREKMERIVESLKGHRSFELSDVFYGIGKVSIGMDTVGELLDATGKTSHNQRERA